MRLLIRLLLLVSVIIGVVFGLLLLLPPERIASIAEDQISKLTGRAVSLEGDTRITFWPILGVSTELFTVANADWSEGGPMMRARNLKIGVEPQAFWGGAVRITGLEATEPELLLERHADGRVNWELGVEGVAPSGQSDGEAPATARWIALTLDRALIQNARITYADHSAGQTTTLSGVSLDLRWPEYEGAAQFEASLATLGGGAGRIAVTGTLDPVSTFMDGGLSALDLQITAPGGTARFTGEVTSAPEVQGALTAEFSETATFLAALGLTGVDIPAGLGQRASVETLLTLTEDQRLALRETALTLDQNRLTGGADITLSGAVPQVSAQLRAGALDLSGFGGSDSNNSGSGTPASSAGWSTAPIDASGLGLAEGSFALVADSINLGDLTLGKTRTRATLTRSRLVFEIAELQLYDGALSGQFVINNRSGLSVGGDLRAEGLNIQTLMRDALDVSRLTGTAAGQVKFLGVGQDMNAIMKSLSGSGSVRTGRGVIEGIDLDSLMRAGDLTGGTTVFDSLTASFTMEGGQLRNDDLLMSLPLARAEGQGRVGLGPRDIDYLFTPVLLSGENRQGLAIPVRITGPWADPRIQPDLERAIDLNLEAEREALEAEIKAERDRLEERAVEALQEELGVTVEEGQSVEDALRDALEDELGEGLLRLFE